MTSRLDRLLLLLDTGTSSAIRETAARQIAQFAAKNVAKDAGADIIFKDSPSTSSTHVWQGTSSEWADVMAVVGKILPYLHSKSFETRTAATSALSHICQMTPSWAPRYTDAATECPDLPAPSDFPPFSVTQLLKTGTLLLASSGTEFSELVALGTPAEVARARKEAMNRLGLGFMDGVDDDELGLEKELADDPDAMDVDEKDVKPSHSSTPPPSAPDDSKTSFQNQTSSSQRPPKLKVETNVKSEDTDMVDTPSELAPADSMDDLSGLSARERNRLKRKRKAGGSAFVSAPTGSKTPQSSAPPPSKMRVVGTEDGPRAQPAKPLTPVDGKTASSEKVVIDPTKGGQVEAKEKAAQALALNVPEGMWVWGGVISVLQVDLFSPNWEIRHGAAMALREVIKVRGASGGMREGNSRDENFVSHEKWCNDLAAKFLCLFVLDRFSDFVSDQVVAPVRETVSQTLAALLTHMPRRAILHVHNALLEMINLNQESQPSHGNGKSKGSKAKGKAHAGGGHGGGEHAWQVKHAGLVGIKYEVAVRPDLFEDEAYGQNVLKGVVEAAVSGLCDPDDDVRSVAAMCLTPITKHLVERLSTSVSRVLDVLWDCLQDMKDDLSSSVGFVMDLLGKLLSFDLVISSLANSNTSRPLSQLVPVLYPFFRHTIANVRLAVVNTLNNFLSVANFPDDWISPPVLQLLFQNLIVEERIDIRAVSLEAWRAIVLKLSLSEQYLLDTFGPHIRDWFTILMTPLGSPIDVRLFYNHSRAGAEHGHNVDKSILNQDLSLVSSETILRTRVVTSKALAILLSLWPVKEQDEVFGIPLKFYMDSSSMLQQFLSATIVQEWATEADALSKSSTPQPLSASSPLASQMVERFFTFLQKDPPTSYYEMYLVLSRISAECRALLNAFTTEAKVPSAAIPVLPTVIDTNGTTEGAFTIQTAEDTVQDTFTNLKGLVQRTKRKELPGIEIKRQKVVLSIKQYGDIKTQHDSRVAAAVAGALIALREMPTKLNPVIRSVMNGVKFEENLDLQIRAARSVAAFTSFYATSTLRANPIEKIIKNLCTFICQDVTYAPVFTELRTVLNGILTVKKSNVGKGKPPTKKDAEEVEAPGPVSGFPLIRRGAQLALSETATEFGPRLFDALPTLWECMVQSMLDTYATFENVEEREEENGQNVIDCLTIIHSIAPTLDATLHSRIGSVFPSILRALRSRFAILRQCAAQCLATLCNVMTTDAMRLVIEEVIPLLGDSRVVGNRQGAIEVIHNIVQLLDTKVLPYIIFLIVPVLGRMSDPDDDLRFLATNTFASLVKMVPLEAGLPDPQGFSEKLLARRETERAFLTQLLDGSKVETYQLPVTIKAELRKYQQDGVNWLAFLAKFQLHGILCDDMGLGKTLQSICILASKHHERAEKFKATHSADSTHLPSLIVCPPTLVGHWYHEILKYSENLRPTMYVGAIRERAKVANSLNTFDVVITSYDVVRNDIAALGKNHWHYCILDEGHIIKNAKAKLTKAVKLIQAHHRLILSGTPIQNNVLELWSLFDFLMPGFLGTESYFNERFGRPITASRDNKASPKVRDAATMALEALHKQVLPFLLRRLKEDVLNDLPPKIIQDYYCDLSSLQKQLYDEYANSQAKLSAEVAVQKSEGGKESTEQKHVFQSLQYLRKICNHPALVLKDPTTIAKITPPGAAPLDLREITHAPKLEALRQLLTDCGVGVDPAEMKEETALDTTETAISQHRVLIFCQMKQMLDIIEQDLFKAQMPTVTYMRLDGTTDANKRHAIVETFNADPSIDCLLLTTHIGGLGLTLTGADTVIFVEHDWNPMKDLQAMDRAHRLGQKKVVNVYRLITKGTLEEKIMGLQRFKLNIANSVITQQNSGLSSMDTDLVLDLFKRTTDEEDAAAKKRRAQEGPATQKSVLEGLEDLPPEDEYNFDLPSFLGTLGK